MTERFQPWEIPTGGKAPRLRYGIVTEAGVQRLVSNSSLMLAIRRADGRIDPMPRFGSRVVYPGDEVFLPPSETAPVDARELFRTRVDGVVAYQMAWMPAFDEDDETREAFNREPRPEVWWWYRRELPHGRVLHLHQASSNARLSVSLIDAMGFEGSWCYPHHDEGWRAAMGWNGWGDPPDGWIRHLETQRRRKDGTAATEYVQHSDVTPDEVAFWRVGAR